MYWDDFIDALRLMIIVAVVIVIVISGFMGLSWIMAGFEVHAWNKFNNTNYTQMDWFSGSDFIKKYHYPNRESTEKKEINVNVNS